MRKQTLSRIRFRGLVISLALMVLMFPTQQLPAHTAVCLTLNDKPLHYSLQEGETTLIVRVPNASLLERFSLVNENSRVHGELKIAVAASRLPINDPKWVLVSGNVAFAHKRCFNLSMVGVEAKYVKLSFHVEKENQFKTAGL